MPPVLFNTVMQNGENSEPVTPFLRPISRRELRLTLVREGISLESVQSLIDGMPDGLAKEEAKIEWADATEFNRNHPTLLIIADALGLTSEQIDAMWIKAMQA